MLNRKDIICIIVYLLAVLAVGAVLAWILIEYAPYLLGLIALPAWLFAALADGANLN